LVQQARFGIAERNAVVGVPASQHRAATLRRGTPQIAVPRQIRAAVG